jgi:hypothetical protein
MLKLAAIILLLAAPAYAGDTRYVWTNSPFQAKADDCAETDTIPETGLSHALLRLARLDIPDTLDLPDKPLTGPGAADSVLVSTIDSVWAHVMIVRSVDAAGNRSCLPVSYLQVVPVTEWPPSQAPVGPPGLEASYFDHPDFSGTRADVIDAQLNFAAGAWPTHNTGPGQFSAYWTGFIQVAGAGFYSFRAQVSGAVRLWVDTRAVIDDWGIASDRSVGGSIGLLPGQVAFRAEYRNDIPNASLKLYWTPPGGSEAVVPASALSH